MDRAVIDFLAQLPDHKTAVMDCVLPAENLAKTAFGPCAVLIAINTRIIFA